MDRKLSRRTATKLIGAGAAALLGASGGAAGSLDVFPGVAEAHTGAGIRRHGVVLTSATTTQLSDCISKGGYDTLKVVTSWGVTGGWTTARRQSACGLTPVTIVRTDRGDGADRSSMPVDWAYPVASNIIAEVTPWYQIKPSIAIELGNEPNGNTGWRNPSNPLKFTDQFIWEWRYHLDQTITQCQAQFPNAPLMSPGLETTNTNDLVRWFNIAADVMNRCHFIGFHAYATCDFWGSHLSTILPLLQQYFPGKLWALTEFGIHDKWTAQSPNTCSRSAPTGPYSTVDENAKYQKGRAYAQLLHAGGSSPQLPSNVWCGTYFHLNTAASYSSDSYTIYPQGDVGYKSITG